MIAVSDKYFRHKVEDSLAVLLPNISSDMGLLPVANSLNYTDKNKAQVIEFIEWQDAFKDHDRRRFEPSSQGCTLNINKSLLKNYAIQKGLDIYDSVTLRRSVDKYKPESQMDWVEQLFVTKINL